MRFLTHNFNLKKGLCMRKKFTKILVFGMIFAMMLGTMTGCGMQQQTEIYNPEGSDDELWDTENTDSGTTNTDTGSTDTQGSDDSSKSDVVINDTNGDLASALTNGYIVIGAVMREPFLYDEDDYPVGFYIDVAQLFAYCELGLQVRVSVVEEDTMYDQLASGEVDCIWTCVDPDDLAGKDVDVSDPLLIEGQCFIVPSYNEYTSAEDLKGQTIAVVKDSEGEELMKTLGYTYVTAETINDMLTLVENEECAAAVMSTLEADEYIVYGYYTFLTKLCDLEDNEHVVIFRKGSGLCERFNQYLDESWVDVEERATSYSFGTALPLEEDAE